MRLHVISDVHGRAGALRTAAVGADALFCLGDLLLFVDYADEARGIFAELFDAAGHVRAAAARQYAELFAALPEPAYLTYGNVDLPQMWAEHLRPGHHVLDGERLELGGWTFGFVGGGLRSPYRTPNELDDDAYAAKVAAVSGADVLCAHIPPAIPELLYDTVARRLERGSAALLAEIKRSQPRYLLFGHVHQPLARRVRIGRTECINVGHFRATGTPYVLTL